MFSRLPHVTGLAKTGPVINTIIDSFVVIVSMISFLLITFKMHPDSARDHRGVCYRELPNQIHTHILGCRTRLTQCYISSITHNTTYTAYFPINSIYSRSANRHFQFIAYVDVDTYVNTYSDLKYRGRVNIFSKVCEIFWYSMYRRLG